MKLDPSYYLNHDVVGLARSFLGKVMVSHIDGSLCSGMITETEAYAGISDRASHAYGDRHTARTATMYREGGCAYVYLIYGIHSLFNIVTGPEGTPHAVLVRALKPLDGLGVMKKRRNTNNTSALCNGPGKLTVAMGIHYSHSGESLSEDRIWIEDRGIRPAAAEVVTGRRIGVDYAGEDALLPYRFILDGPLLRT